jgi:NADH:ubiquinone oxidoreductase subunit F (NADH-binding)/(2Fe-2S) ferredoxin
VIITDDGCRPGVRTDGKDELTTGESVKSKGEPGIHDIGVISRTGCHGLCQKGPLVTVQPLAAGAEEILYCHVTPDDVPEIIDKSIHAGDVIERLLYHDPATGHVYRDSHEIPFYAKQKRITLADCGRIEPESIEEYIMHGGYTAARSAITQMTPEQICDEIMTSGLRGRGGAGFLTGRKWQITLAAKSDTKYIICNADDGGPGAYMDRSTMEGDPHRVLEGAIIAAYATGARHGYFYIRTEYPFALVRMQKAIDSARQAGLLGKALFGSNFSFDCEVVESAGAFVCGEETAVLASIEGRRGVPRVKPPFPAQNGLFGKPTVINNVETLATIREIVAHGAAAFRKYGTPQSSGTKTFALAGRVVYTGLIEVPFGITLREIVYDIGGGIPDGRKFKAVQIGGPSGGCLTVEHLDMPLDFENLLRVGAMVGSGGIVVMDDSTCIVEVTRFFMQFMQQESCGKCVPCREGTKQMLGILQDIVDGKSQPGDIELLEETARAVKIASLCGLGKTAPNPLISTLKLFRSEYQAHIDRRYCPAVVCSALKTYAIDPSLCKGCTRCAMKCPAGAVEGEKREVHRINVTKCTKCGICASLCKFHAISAV